MNRHGHEGSGLPVPPPVIERGVADLELPDLFVRRPWIGGIAVRSEHDGWFASASTLEIITEGGARIGVRVEIHPVVAILAVPGHETGLVVRSIPLDKKADPAAHRGGEGDGLECLEVADLELGRRRTPETVVSLVGERKNRGRGSGIRDRIADSDVDALGSREYVEIETHLSLECRGRTGSVPEGPRLRLAVRDNTGRVSVAVPGSLDLPIFLFRGAGPVGTSGEGGTAAAVKTGGNCDRVGGSRFQAGQGRGCVAPGNRGG